MWLTKAHTSQEAPTSTSGSSSLDEPELSLHPKWQQRIIEVYKKIGENNQIIIATHSPHILGSVSSENIFILYRDENGKIEAKTGEKYGY